MTRRSLAEDMASTYGGKLVNVQQIAEYTGVSRSTAEREICIHCTTFYAGERKRYHVTDVAAVLDRKMEGKTGYINSVGRR